MIEYSSIHNQFKTLNTGTNHMKKSIYEKDDHLMYYLTGHELENYEKHGRFKADKTFDALSIDLEYKLLCIRQELDRQMNDHSDRYTSFVVCVKLLVAYRRIANTHNDNLTTRTTFKTSHKF
jgi:hypothetical protein